MPTIDVGAEANSRVFGFSAGSTLIALDNPANESGTLKSVEIYASTPLTGCMVGTFYWVIGTGYKCRAGTTIGDVPAGSKQTFGISLAVEVGDYIGIYYASGTLCWDQTGLGVYYVAGEHVHPNLGYYYILETNAAMSVYATSSTFVSPSTKSLVLTTYVPVITVAGAQLITPGTIALILNTFAPIVTAGGSQIVTPSSISLILVTYTPVITITGPQVVTPSTIDLILTTYAPFVTVEGYDYIYNMIPGTHTFFAKTYTKRLVNPNYVIVRSQIDDDSQYTGFATDPSYSIIEKRILHRTYLTSHEQGQQIAQAMINKAKLESEGGSGTVPINIGAEVYDRVKIIDPKENDYRDGNIGYINSHYSIIHKKWEMTFGFGGWGSTKNLLDSISSPKELLDTLKDETDLGETIEKSNAKDLYAEHIHTDSLDIVWVDPDGNIDLALIGDNLDNLLTGTTYGKVKSAALDVNGLVLLDMVVEGTKGSLLATSISAGHIKLTSNTASEGKWYQKSGVIIDADYGIALYGSQIALRTYPTLADALAGTNLQIYVGTDGKLYAGAGAVCLDYLGLSIYGQYLTFYYGATSFGWIYGDGTRLQIQSGGSGNIIKIAPGSSHALEVVASKIFNPTAVMDIGDASAYPISTLWANYVRGLVGVVVPWYASAAEINGSIAYDNGGLDIYANGAWKYILYDG